MTKYTLQVGGMACSMCEAHVNNAVRKAFPVKKVSSSTLKRKPASQNRAKRPFLVRLMRVMVVSMGRL